MACGEPHPDFILNKLTSRQFTECVAYNKVEPFGHDTLFFLIGQLTSILFNVNRGKNTSAKRVWDFVPFIRQNMGKQNPNSMKGLLMGLVRETDPNRSKEVEKRITQTKRYRKRMKLLKEQRKNKGGDNG